MLGRPTAVGRNRESETSEAMDAQYSGRPGKKPIAVGRSIVGILGELLLTFAVICALYVVWQLWWTGVTSQQIQDKQVASAAWALPNSVDGSYKIAKPQPGNPPVEAAPKADGELLGQIYIPRFGAQWERTIVQGTNPLELAQHGLGHYPKSQMPGELGNFAVAGHRSGYGEPLGNVNELQKGDAIIIRTKNYWYVYTDQSYEIVLPTQVDVVWPVPGQRGVMPTQRLITLTTCTPRYTHATHRWVVHGTLKYWAKVSDGIPEELAIKGDSGNVQFAAAGQSWESKIPPLTTILLWLLIAYAIIFLAAAIVWQWPAFRKAAHSAHAKVRTVRTAASSRMLSLYSGLLRIQPGVSVIRYIELILLILMAVVCLFQWVYPWASLNIPYLKLTSNYASVGTE